MLCFCASLFWFLLSIISFGIAHSRIYLNRAPQLFPEDAAKICTPDAVLADQVTGIATFMHISDIHVSARFISGQEWESFVSEIVERLIKPDKVVVSGDLVHQMSGRKTMHNDTEWEEYYRPISSRDWGKCDFWMDMRGNHDSVGIINSFTDDDRFRFYSSCGPQLKYLVSNSIPIEPDPLFLPQYATNPTISLILLDTILEPSLVQPCGYMAGYPQCGSGDIGVLERRSEFFEALRKMNTNNSLGTFIFTHGSLLSMNEPLRSDLLELLRGQRPELRPIFGLLNGHIHGTNIARSIYTRSPSHKHHFTKASHELNVGAFSTRRAARLFFVDHGIVGFRDADWTNEKWKWKSNNESRDSTPHSSPTRLWIENSIQKPEANLSLTQPDFAFAVVLNPPTTSQITSRSQWSIVQNSTHIRVLLYSHVEITKARVVIFPGKHNSYPDSSIPEPFWLFQRKEEEEGRWFVLRRAKGEPGQTNSRPLFVAEWNPKSFVEHPVYTMFVILESDLHHKPRLSSSFSGSFTSLSTPQKQILLPLSPLTYTSPPHTFSVTGHTTIPSATLFRFIFQLPATQMVPMTNRIQTDILVGVFVAARFLGLVGYFLEKVKTRQVGPTQNKPIMGKTDTAKTLKRRRAHQKKQQSKTTKKKKRNTTHLSNKHQTRSHHNTTSAHPPFTVVMSRIHKTLNEVVSNPTPLLSTADINPSNPRSLFSSLVAFGSRLHLDTVVPFLVYLLPYTFAEKLDRFRRRILSYRIVRKSIRQKRKEFSKKRKQTPPKSESDIPSSPSPIPTSTTPLPLSGFASRNSQHFLSDLVSLGILSPDPPTFSLSRPHPKFSVRFCQFLVLELYPYYHLPLSVFFLVTVGYFVAPHVPLVSGHPVPPIKPIKLYIRKNEQGGSWNKDTDTGQVYWMMFLSFAIMPTVAVVAHWWAGSNQTKTRTAKRIGSRQDEYQIHISPHKRKPTSSLLQTLFSPSSELTPPKFTRSFLPLPLSLFYSVMSITIIGVNISLLSSMGASFVFSTIAIPSLFIVGYLHIAAYHSACRPR
ncbi:hypothetical protein BLNAU_15984 [Blattamonas nauphoetae]|uniref:Calcineurin-like phosphoesterase domain-containing protein n=1 Tax=Blattamonas nauphoetae TaxID=2049346 RepID=A0ABQ9XCE5_9EUKA|nr:hypothetical protein BLNAU_15984 [Blattamonas nauphoetae]